MIQYLALLRGVNVVGRKMVAMADLRTCCEKLGFDEANTLLQSGNVVFKTSARSAASLERKLESEVKKRCGVETRVFVRNGSEWRAAVEANPFADEARHDPGHLLLMCLRDAPDAKSVNALRAAIVGRELVHADGRHAYLVYPDGVGRSRMTSNLIEKHLGTSGTARNWNTVLKLAALVAR
jgi:uncharacterized protein (DUF1697 family)